MRSPTEQTHCPAALEALHRRFLALLPYLERQVRLGFRALACPHRREEAEAESLALAWQWFCRLAQRGQEVSAFLATFAAFLVRAVGSDRRLPDHTDDTDANSRILLPPGVVQMTKGPLPPNSPGFAT